MKNVKYYLFGFITCFIVIFVIGVILSSINSSKKIYIKSLDDFDDSVSSLKLLLDSVEDTTCKSSINELLERSVNTYYKNNVSINEYVNNYYSNNTDFYQVYLETLNSCNNDINDVKDITKLVIASKVFPESMKAKLNSSYEIKFIDYINYKSVNELSDNLGSYSSKELELMAIDNLISKNANSCEKYK